MNKKISIVFRVDADKKTGLGHLSRCRSLIAAFSKIASCDFSVLSRNKSLIRKFIPELDLDVYNAGHFFRQKYFDIAIVDLLKITNREKRHIEKISRLTACVDDEGLGLKNRDILIRPNLLRLPRPQEVPPNNYWTGRDYIILHPDFEMQALKKEKARTITKIFVCFGGSDPCALTLKVIPILKKLGGNTKIVVILGPAFPWKKNVESMIKDDNRFLLKFNVEKIAPFLGAADIALISGGTLMYEACSLGIPAIIISQNKAQEKEAIICDTAGAVINSGLGKAVSDKKITGILQDLISNRSRRMKMAKIGPKIVSRNGAARIAKKILACLKERAKQ